MANIGIFCGTAGGTSMAIAKALAKEFDVDEIINMEEDFDNVDQLLEYDILFSVLVNSVCNIQRQKQE